MKTLMSIFALFIAPAFADELPSKLLFKCDLKQTVFMKENGNMNVRELNIEKNFRLDKGVLSWTDHGNPIGKDCELANGKVFCEHKEIRTSNLPGIGKVSEKRESSVTLDRQTGEISIQLKTWNREGESKVFSDPEPAMTLYQKGLCRSGGARVF
jgi:hypothetical protein